MDTQNKKAIKGFVILVMALGLVFLYVLALSNSVPGSENLDQESGEQKSFSEQSRERFDDLVRAVPELQSITCLPDTCTNVAYFDYSILSDDFEMMVRSNAASFSKFKLDNTGTSNVTVYGQVEGKTLLQCDAQKGEVKECKGNSF